MIYSRITGTGSALPANCVSNADLAARGIDTSDEWIQARTGIKTRYLATPMVCAGCQLPASGLS